MKILLVDDDAERARLLLRVLAIDPGNTIVQPPRGALLLDVVTAQAPDVVLVDMARPDHDMLERLRRLSTHDSRPIALLVGQDDTHFMEAAVEAGVSSYNVMAMPPRDIVPILRAAVALFRRQQLTLAALHSANNRLEERSIIDQAKTRLIRERRLSEPDAYGWLRSTAMARGRKIVDVARQVLGEAEQAQP